MAALPERNHTTAQAVIEWRERTADKSNRPHLGASIIGHACDRHLWYVFRWVAVAVFEGRVLRLFDTGKREEPRVYEELRGIGCEVHADDGTGQFRVGALGGHFAGSMDGVIRGIPEAPAAWHVLEIKTHSDKLFADLLKKRVREAKPMHWAQMQTYMRLAGVDRALYFAVNKNTDAVYTERVEYDEEAAQALVERARRIITAPTPPARLSKDPAWFECKFCNFHPVCHGAQVPEVNCRTCANSTPVVNDSTAGVWTCGADGITSTLSTQTQRDGCPRHVYIPPLLAALGEPVDTSPAGGVVYQAKDGGQFVNGPGAGEFASAEIRTAADPRVLSQPDVQALKQQYPTARITA